MVPTDIKKNSRVLSDAELAQRTAAGDQDAFELLMQRHNRSLYRTARSILKDDVEAEDALQDAYLLAYQRLHQFRGDSSLSTWLTRIVVNEAIARSRKTTRRAQIIHLEPEPHWDTEAAEAQSHRADIFQPEQAALRAEARRLIEKNIDALPEAFRTVFMLRAVEEMTVEETAACLEIPEATVRSRYFRAKGLLREALSRELDIALQEVFSFDGARCARIVAGVLTRLDHPDQGAPESVVNKKGESPCRS